MKFIANLLLIAIFGAIVQLFLPWWSLAVIAFLTGLSIYQNGLVSFLAGFFGAAIVWWCYAFFIDWQTQSILSSKVADILQLKSAFLLLIASGAVGGLVAGFASLSGNLLRKIISG